MLAFRPVASSSLSLPSGSYIYSLAAALPGLSLAAISSDDSLRLFDVRSLQVVSVTAGSTHENGVTTLTEYSGVGTERGLLVTGGRDGKVRLWDVRSASGKPMLEMTTAKNAAVLSLACRAETNSIVAGTELVSSQAAVVFWDIRSPRDHRLQYVESHNDDVTELQFHPTQESVLLSGSTDGLVNVYDMTITDEDDAVLQVINHGSIHHAGFLSEHAIYALSHDESFSIHPTTDPDNTAQDPGPIRFGDLRQHLSCEYVVQTLTSGQGTHLAAGNTTEKRLDLVPLMPNPQWQFDQSNVSRLLGAHGEEIIRSLYLDEQWGSIFTCGEDGLVRAWKPDDASTGQDDLQGAAHQEEAATSNTKLPQAKKDRKKPKDEKRFRPYHIK